MFFIRNVWLPFTSSDAKWPVLVAIDIRSLRSLFSFIFLYNKYHRPSGHFCILYYLPGNASQKAQKGSQQPLPCGILRSPVFYQRKWLALAWLAADPAPWLYSVFAMIFFFRRVDSQKPLGFVLCPQLDLLWALDGLFIVHLPTKCSDRQYFSYE